MGLGRSVQVVQEAAAAESRPARGQGCLAAGGVLLPSPFQHVHWGRGWGGERDPVRGDCPQRDSQAAPSPPGVRCSLNVSNE